MYSNLNKDQSNDWTRPTPHERLICKTKVQELFYIRIFAFFILTIISAIISKYFNQIWLIFIPFVLAVMFYPLLVRPWEIILSNKRLILRNQYWNISRFSTIISFNLKQLDSQQISPRLKLFPVTLGFTILTSYSLVLFNFYLTASPPQPIMLKMIFIFFSSIPIVSQYKGYQDNTVSFFYEPFLDEALFFSFITAIISIPLIIFGLPRRQKMLLSTTGGHQLTIDAGIDKELTDYLFAIGRKHRIKESPDIEEYNWNIPLLDDEEIKTKAGVGLIERKAQIIGLLGLIIFIDSLDQLFYVLSNPNFRATIILSLKILDLVFIWMALTFAKKFRRIIATNHRLLYQEEIRQVSGMWGKRIYQYNDLPYKYIQGFRYSNFSAMKIDAVFGLAIILIGLTSIISTDKSSAVFIGLLFISIYLLLNYRNYTSLSFVSIGGGRIELTYKIPVFWINLLHRMEGKQRLYDKFFPNILNEYEVVDLCNTIRGVENPQDTLDSQHEIKVKAFMDVREETIREWSKIGQFPFAKGSAILGAIIGIYCTYALFSFFETPIKYIFLLFAIYLIIGLTMHNLILRYRTLIILKDRIFYIEEILPRKIAQTFGILPERSIQEVSAKYIIANRFAISFGKKFSELIRYFSLVIISLYFLYSNNSIMHLSSGLTREVLVFIFSLLLIIGVIPFTRSVFQNIPKYRLRIYTRFGLIEIPYMKDLDQFNAAIKKARE